MIAMMALSDEERARASEMDTVAGATVSSNNFRLLVGQILATAAVNGDTEKTLEVESFPADLGPAEEEASSSSEAAA